MPISPFLGKTVAEVEEDRRYHLEVEGLLRDERRLDGGAAEERVRVRDVPLLWRSWAMFGGWPGNAASDVPRPGERFTLPRGLAQDGPAPPGSARRPELGPPGGT